MTILRLRNYEADAEVLGTVCRVEYVEVEQGGRLTIFGVDIGFAGRILERLATGAIKGVEQNKREPPPDVVQEAVKTADFVAACVKLREASGAPIIACKAALEAAKGDFDVALASLKRPVPARVDPNPTIPPGALRVVPPEAVKDLPHVADIVGGSAAPAPVASPVAACAPEQGTLGADFEKADASAARAEQAKLVAPELEGAKRLRDVLVYFEAQGIKGADALVEACLAVKGSVPVLTRIANLPERVRRTYEIVESERSGS